jgi:pimeloyl-ACP methyl ester carboxylesterase
VVSAVAQGAALTAPIHVARWGSSGPRVVLVHGGTQGSEAGGERHFEAQRPLAERGWRLIVPDRPGHGRSPDPGRPDDAEADGAWLAELLEDGAHLVGHSFGGCVALSAAARRPAAVQSLTLIEPAMHALAVRDPRVRPLLLRMLMLRLFPAASRARRALKLLGIPPELVPPNAEALRRVGRSLARIRIPSQQALSRELAAIERAGVPLLVVTGGWSPAFEATGDAVAAAGRGRHVVIPCPHHFPQLVADEFNRGLEAFLKEAAGARAGVR